MKGYCFECGRTQTLGNMRETGTGDKAIFSFYCMNDDGSFVGHAFRGEKCDLPKDSTEYKELLERGKEILKNFPTLQDIEKILNSDSVKEIK